MIRPGTLALFREAADRLRRETGEALDDDALLLAMARRILRGPEDPSRANYQVAVTVCASCGQGSIDAAGEVYQASRGLGFRANEAREAIDRARPTTSADWPLKQCLSQTLKLLGEAAKCCAPGGGHRAE